MVFDDLLERSRTAKVSEALTWKLRLNIPLEIDAWFAGLDRPAASLSCRTVDASPPRQDETS